MVELVDPAERFAVVAAEMAVATVSVQNPEP
jgi:hypothetical protein